MWHGALVEMRAREEMHGREEDSWRQAHFIDGQRLSRSR